MGPGILGQRLDGGTLNTLSPNSSKEEMVAALNDIIIRLNTMLKAQVFSDGENKRMIIGFQKDGWGPGKDFGIKVSRDGIDVTSATDDQLLLSFDLETWYYYQDGVNVGQIGKLPNGMIGEAWAKKGESVAAAITP